MHNTDGTFRTHRVLPYSPAAVYAAFESPVLLARWWGPAGFTNEFEVFEFHEGGRWQFVMVGPDGTRHPNLNRFDRLQPGAQVVIRHESAPRFTLTVELDRVPEGTRLAWTQAFDDAAVAAAVKPIVVPANEQNLDRLTAVLGAA
jgi:uncharacterized protein YndB with AHSA1/START domain